MTRGARRLIVPEVIASSLMDCGPAALHSLLAGHGISTNYDRLRDACGTDVDGTSINTVEDLANLLGLQAEQQLMPVDHVVLDESGALPAVVITVHPNGLNHLVVVWRRHGGWVQVMDPSVGRRWLPIERFQNEVRVYRYGVPVDDVATLLGSDAFLGPLARRLRDLCGGQSSTLVQRAQAAGHWAPVAALDAATRMVAALVAGGAVAHGSGALALVTALAGKAATEPAAIPGRYWFVLDDPSAKWPSGVPEGTPVLFLQGSVLVNVAGLHPAPLRTDELPPAVAAARREPPPQPWRHIGRLLRQEGIWAAGLVGVAAVLSAVAVFVEQRLFRALIDAPPGTAGSRLGALVAVAATLLVLEVVYGPLALRLGRGIEGGLRRAWSARVPLLPDRYFRTRAVSDLAERAHRLHQLRQVPRQVADLLRTSTELVIVAVAIGVVDHRAAVPAALAALLPLALGVATQASLNERDLRMRNHGATMARIALDALLALVPIRAHGAERTVRTEHDAVLREWARSFRSLRRVVLSTEAVQAVGSLLLLVWVVVAVRDRAALQPGTFLLLAYWAFRLPVVGQHVVALARQYPWHRTVTLRFLEPLNAPDDPAAVAARRAATTSSPGPVPGGVSIQMEQVSVEAGDRSILSGVDLSISAGEHVAIVGLSGAGKSTLLRLLLGWLPVSSGTLRLDGKRLDPDSVAALRRETAWVEPGVQLWNTSLADNVRYGSDDLAAAMSAALDDADLRSVVEALPGGVDEILGEGGALLSGGEGQRVRLARARNRHGVRLALLDEPFRGVDRAKRSTLLKRARAWWDGATLLFVTHDVHETLSFDRVLVIDGGRVVEDGDPQVLGAAVTRYRRLLDAESAARALIEGPNWRRVRVEMGKVTKAGARTTEPAGTAP